MKSLLFVLSFLPIFAIGAMKFSFQNVELEKMIETYAKASGQKFIVDPGVKGKATITSSESVSKEEAFELLSSALAVNGYAISKQGETMVIKSARNIQRDLIETSTTLPALKPERMVTYIVTFQHVPVSLINRDLRILPSKDGEFNLFPANNQIIFTDWVSNIHRIDAILKQIDRPMDPKISKLAAENQKNAPPPIAPRPPPPPPKK